MMFSMESRCSDLGLTISCKKTKLLAVLPHSTCQQPVPVSLRSGANPIEVVHQFEYLGSVVSDDCSTAAEVDSRICKASQAFHSLSRVLWYQRRIKSRGVEEVIHCSRERVLDCDREGALDWDSVHGAEEVIHCGREGVLDCDREGGLDWDREGGLEQHFAQKVDW